MERLVKIAAVCIVLSAIILLSNRIGVVEGQRRGRPARRRRPGLKGGNDAFGLRSGRKLAEANGRESSRPSGLDLVAVHRHFSRESRSCLRDAERRVAGPSARARDHLAPADRAEHQVPRRRRLPCAGAASATPSHGRAADGSDGRPGVDWRWEHVVYVLDRSGKIIDEANWAQWDKIWGRPHDVEISPDPEKNVWIVDADNHFAASSRTMANSAC